MAYIPRRRQSRSFGITIPGLGKLNKQKLGMYVGVGLVGMIIFGFVCAFGLFAWYGRDLPQPGKLSEARGSSTVFYDREGEIIYEMYKDKNRIPVEGDEIPEMLKQATVAIEDKRFYEHKGVSEFGILRAFFNNYVLGNPQGGSTITQQLIKNVLLSSERTLPRKIKEAILAFEVEKRYTKDEILTMYLNENPYGGSFWGVGSAARGYFNKDPKELTLVEAAILAGLPQSPSRYSPFIGEEGAWKVRATDVLRRMEEDEYITEDQEEAAVKQLDKVKFSSEQLSITAPHFIFYLRNQIEEEFGPAVLNQGIEVKTTLDLEMQKKAEKIIKDEIEDLEKYDVGNGALVALDPKNGEIISYVGSYDYNNEAYGKFDVVSQGNRQPGSTLKPIEYATAFEKGYTPATVLMDVETTFPNQGGDDYVPKNYDGKYHGPTQIRFALGNSFNVPAVKMLAMIGLRDFLQQSYDMGLTSLEPTQENIDNLGLSASLGGGETTLLELVSAYSVFANEGTKTEIQGILEIKDHNGKSIYKKKKPVEKEVLSPEISFLISHILSDNNARVATFGTGSYLQVPGKTVAVKTGTTDDKKDNWAVGYTNGITLGVWVGNNDGQVMNPAIASGATGASPIWHNFMVELLKKYDDGIMEKPDDVEAVTIDAYLGGLPKDGNPTRSEYFIKGTEPTDISPYYKTFDGKEYIVINETDPISTDGKNRWQEAIDAWAASQSDERFKNAGDKVKAESENISLSIKSPGNETTVNTNDVEVKVKISTDSTVKRVRFWINDEEKKTLETDSKDITEKFNLPDGKYTIKIQAWNDKDKSSDSSIKIGVNQPWN
ncbi:MAG: penicillin-binding protein [Weeksellaceae bacterium]